MANVQVPIEEDQMAAALLKLLRPVASSENDIHTLSTPEAFALVAYHCCASLQLLSKPLWLSMSIPFNRFFHTQGAVAGTFTAVGIVALIIIIFPTTMYIWRRHNRKFNEEIDKVAAAVATAGMNPDFLHDNYDY
ncbi:hypothetical protein K488DRAFT_91055 [Vararia minispora EC-137]|uniref:Uncharacterized protein n=1 Tax=Vararia minispora EC-137 TaxID=1314806 RepID=A0ACB8Q664_9AGAM|nr:hypothetical protein K488DRAFT_91055 [Vararia minispora EC-137]